jgi:hypothetical protein
MSEAAIWYYEWNGRPAGPVVRAALVELVQSGRLRPQARVWRPGMPEWQPLQAVPDVVSAVEASRTPPPSAVAARPTGLEPVAWGVFVALTLVTLGVYAVVQYYRAGRAYEALAGRSSRFTTWFWLYVGLLATGFLLSVGGARPLGALAFLAHLVFGVLSLVEAVALRGEGVRRFRVQAPLVSEQAHRALTIAAAASIGFGIGLVLAIVEGVLFFHDHDTLARALEGAAQAGGTPLPVATPPPGAGRACPACGNPLSPTARFCERCGKGVQ